MKVYTVIDFETTGLDPEKDQVTEIGAIKKAEDGTNLGKFHTYVKLANGKGPSPYTPHITKEICDTGMNERIALDNLFCFADGTILIMQYAPFDLSFFNRLPGEQIDKWFDFIDTRTLAKVIEPKESPSLKYVAERFNIVNPGEHEALSDCFTTWRVFQRMKNKVSPLFDGDLDKWINTVMDFDIEGRRLRYTPYGARVLLESDVVKGKAF